MDINITLDKSHEYNNTCNICYETPCDFSHIIKLKCCKNTKQICINCLNCLTTPICPYCRKELDKKCLPFVENQNYNISRSENYINTIIPQHYTWEQFLYEEHIINPFLYDNSKRLRRQIRKLRYEYKQKRSQYRSQPISIPGTNHNNRRELQNYSRNIMHTFNNIDNMDDNINELLFMLED
jgi:hypothetical protein